MDRTEPLPGALCDLIYEKAKPYLDTRENDVHVSLSYAFAQRLLAHYPEANARIVLPAIILHDVGWKMVPEKVQLKAFGPTLRDKELQRVHEREGARIAEEILDSLGHGKEETLEILAIIDGHDTRREALSLNDALVKDADKLWRFTPEGVEIDYLRFGLERARHLDDLSRLLERWFFTAEARAMAREALVEARARDSC
jgi:hypothetical protein